MLSQETRTLKINALARYVGSIQQSIGEWTKEELAKGNDPNKDIAIRFARLILYGNQGWLDSEKELFALESQFRKLIPREEKKTVLRNRSKESL